MSDTGLLAPARTRRSTSTVGAVAGEFLRTWTARLLVLAALTAAVGRLGAGPFGWSDVAVVGAVVALRPMAEWAVHKLFLHGRPRRLGRFALDPLAARAHRAHHADPRDPRHLLTPPRVIAEFVVAAWVGTALLPPPLGTTALVTVLTAGLAAEWTHTLVHSAYQPRGRWLRSLARAHRLHHHRNENYWFGLTSTAADRALGTAPDPASVPVSATTRTLGITR